MVQVNKTTKGNDRTNRIHLSTNFTQPSLPSSRASLGSGGVARIAGRNGMSTSTASSAVLVLLATPSLVLLSSSLIDASLWCSDAAAGSM